MKRDHKGLVVQESMTFPLEIWFLIFSFCHNKELRLLAVASVWMRENVMAYATKFRPSLYCFNLANCFRTFVMERNRKSLYYKVYFEGKDEVCYESPNIAVSQKIASYKQAMRSRHSLNHDMVIWGAPMASILDWINKYYPRVRQLDMSNQHVNITLNTLNMFTTLMPKHLMLYKIYDFSFRDLQMILDRMQNPTSNIGVADTAVNVDLKRGVVANCAQLLFNNCWFTVGIGSICIRNTGAIVFQNMSAKTRVDNPLKIILNCSTFDMSTIFFPVGSIVINQVGVANMRAPHLINAAAGLPLRKLTLTTNTEVLSKFGAELAAPITHNPHITHHSTFRFQHPVIHKLLLDGCHACLQPLTKDWHTTLPTLLTEQSVSVYIQQCVLALPNCTCRRKAEVVFYKCLSS